MTGLPKRTLDSCTRRAGAPLPGLDALGKMAVGSGVFLDWLVHGQDASAARACLLVRLTAQQAALPVLRNLFDAMEKEVPLPEPEYLASDIGNNAGDLARGVTEMGMDWQMTKALPDRSDGEIVGAMKSKVIDLQGKLDAAIAKTNASPNSGIQRSRVVAFHPPPCAPFTQPAHSFHYIFSRHQSLHSPISGPEPQKTIKPCEIAHLQATDLACNFLATRSNL